MKLLFADPARRDLKSIHDYIAEHNPRSAARVIEKIRASAQLLATFPDIGRRGIVEHICEWLVTGLPYVIVHQIEGQSGRHCPCRLPHRAAAMTSRSAVDMLRSGLA